MTHRERILRDIRGEMADRLPFASRLDLWYKACAQAGTLPERHKHRTFDEIGRAEGGAPGNEKFGRDMGADGCAADGAQAVTLAGKLLQEG